MDQTILGYRIFVDSTSMKTVEEVGVERYLGIHIASVSAMTSFDRGIRAKDLYWLIPVLTIVITVCALGLGR